MRVYRLHDFGLEHLRLEQTDPPKPGIGDVLLRVRAMSLNYRDLLVARGQYSKSIRLPGVPIADAAGEIVAIGPDVENVRVGDNVCTHYVAAWREGPFRAEYLKQTLGLPGPGVAAEYVALPAGAVVVPPAGYDHAQAATLPIAALTAWSALATEADVKPGQTVLTLGTGGVSIFALQIAKARGARVIVTSSSNGKLRRAVELGADATINYREHENWDAEVIRLTDGMGVDVTVETAGIATLERSLKATRANGIVAYMGALTGLTGPINTGLLMMKRQRICGILVDSRAAFEQMNDFLPRHRIAPVIDRRFPFEELPAALRYLETGSHFGKIVVEV
ncbi:MAG: NAD(P)-dependent alcohol dehydrogenase [Phycisphaerales bacterium]|nr:NAD(P)-dependent alcohol dehydrogenase [Phycisphaerales bacterium]